MRPLTKQKSLKVDYQLLDGVEAVANAAGELLGFDPISISLSSVSLPRLAKGAVVTKPTVAEI